MKVELVALDRVDDDFVDAWERLATRAVDPNPFFEAPFVLSAAQHLEGSRGARLLVVRDGDRLVLAVPVVEGTWSRLRIPALRSWRTPYTFVGTPLIDSATGTEPLEAVVRDATSRRGVLVMHWVRADGNLPLPAAMRATGRAASRNRFERPVLRARDAELQALGRKERQTLGRRRRKLERERGPLTTRDVATDPEAVERFLALEDAGWKGEAGTSLSSNAADAAFFRSLCDRTAPSGRLSMWELADADGHTIAMTTRLRSGDGEFDFKRTYDEDLGGYAPGRLLELELLESLQERGHQWVDTCLDPPDPFYARLTDERRAFVDVVVAGRGLLTRTVGHLALRGAA